MKIPLLFQSPTFALAALVFASSSVALTGEGFASEPPATESKDVPAKAEEEPAEKEEVKAPQAKDIPVAKAAEIIEKEPEVVILDVRTPKEFAEGHVSDKAKNIDFLAKDFEKKVANLDKEKTYLLYCRSGGRSSSAMKKMKDLGFLSLYNMEGGITDWEKEGNDVTKKVRKESE